MSEVEEIFLTDIPTAAMIQVFYTGGSRVNTENTAKKEENGKKTDNKPLIGVTITLNHHPWPTKPSQNHNY